MINCDCAILEWIGKNDLKTLHIIRRVIKLKKSSALKKGELIKRISDYYVHFAVCKIQTLYRSHTVNKKCRTSLCPFTLEKPEWPYFVNKLDKVEHYYNLEPLVNYLGTVESRNSIGEPRCPISRKEFTKEQMIEIKNLAFSKNFKIMIPKRISRSEIEKKAIRSLLDDMVGEITDLISAFDTTHTMENYRRTIHTINNNLAPALLDNYLKLKHFDPEESSVYLQDSINTINQEYDNSIKTHFLHLFRVLSTS
tara:strand:- start:7395 stop:8153 length:759 start_codon:yes stop_codon:yes gene_type:complete